MFGLGGRADATAEVLKPVVTKCAYLFHVLWPLTINKRDVVDVPAWVARGKFDVVGAAVVGYFVHGLFSFHALDYHVLRVGM